MLPTVLPHQIVRCNDYNLFAQQWIIQKYGEIQFPSPFVHNPMDFERMVLDYHKSLKVLYSLGGYGANRRRILRGFPGHAQNRYIYHALDINVPPGTPVCVDHDCEVVVVDTDHDEQQPAVLGWGRRIIVAVPKFRLFLVYAHLSPGVHCSVKDKLKAGQLIGRVGTSKNNGQWYPHLHVQMLTPEGWDYFHSRLHELDGYCTPAQLPLMRKWCPNPEPYLLLP